MIDDPTAPVDAVQDPVTHELVPVERFANWNNAFEQPYDPSKDEPAEDPEYVRAKRAGLGR